MTPIPKRTTDFLISPRTQRFSGEQALLSLWATACPLGLLVLEDQRPVTQPPPSCPSCMLPPPRAAVSPSLTLPQLGEAESLVKYS